jgi:hypothetical protein
MPVRQMAPVPQSTEQSAGAFASLGIEGEIFHQSQADTSHLV